MVRAGEPERTRPHEAGLYYGESPSGDSPLLHTGFWGMVRHPVTLAVLLRARTVLGRGAARTIPQAPKEENKRYPEFTIRDEIIFPVDWSNPCDVSDVEPS